MKRKKIITIISIIICICSLISLIFISTNKKENTKNNNKIKKYEIICNQIKKSENAQEDFIIIVKSHKDMNGDISDTINEFKTKYNNIPIYEITTEDLDKQCIKKHFDKTGYYEELVRNEITTIMGYKNGVIKGSMQNPFEIGLVEEHFEQNNIITIPEIKEQGPDYNKYKENIKEKEDYIISIITKEDARAYTIENTAKIFPNIKHDVINFNSLEGNKIYEDIKNQIELEQIYPHAFYFKNGKIIADHAGGFISELEEFKILVEENYNKN